MKQTKLLGIDTGGTFTDFVLLTENDLIIHKVLSTPQAPEQAIMQGIKDLNCDLNNISIVHGSTVATNAVLENKGVKTAYISNLGFKDVLTIGRQARQYIYELKPVPAPAPVADELCFEIDVRMDVNGKQLKALTSENLKKLAEQIIAASPEAIAINLLYSYVDSSDEKTIAAYLKKYYQDLQQQSKVASLPFICLSSEVLAEYKEYERGMATWLNAWIGPKVRGYLQRLEQGVSPAPLTIMQSSGGTIDTDYAANNAVKLLLSGPAGGLAGAQFISQLSAYKKILSFDMGGTSTDVALIIGDLKLTNEGKIGRYPVAVPMVEMHTIGAGGGSIAHIDEGGVLQVGPGSAGAIPGPVCYQQGGTKLTVTDANLLLGRLPADSLLGGTMPLNLDLAKKQMQLLADKINLSLYETAMGIIKIANEHMSQALRVMSVQKGIDTKDLALVPFGGAGGLHVCALADSLQMSHIFIPIHGGVLSAFGMVVAPISRDYSQTTHFTITYVTRVDEAQLDQGTYKDELAIFTKLKLMAEQGKTDLMDEGVKASLINTNFSLDLRYQGQSHSLNISLDFNLDKFKQDPIQQTKQLLLIASRDFHLLHQQRYEHQHQQNIEIVNLRVRVFAKPKKENIPKILSANSKDKVKPKSKPRVEKYLCIYAMGDKVPVYVRKSLLATNQIKGPALISENISTTLIEKGWLCIVDDYGNLELSKQAG